MAELLKTRHARLAVERRRIGRGELRAAVYHPDTVEPGKGYGLERCQAGDVVAIIRRTRRKILLVTAYRTSDDERLLLPG